MVGGLFSWTSCFGEPSKTLSLGIFCSEFLSSWTIWSKSRMIDLKDVTSCFRQSETRLCVGIPSWLIKTGWVPLLPNESKRSTWSWFVWTKKSAINDYRVDSSMTRTGMEWFREARGDIFCRGVVSVEQRLYSSIPGEVKTERLCESCRLLIQWKFVRSNEISGMPLLSTEVSLRSLSFGSLGIFSCICGGSGLSWNMFSLIIIQLFYFWWFVDSSLFVGFLDWWLLSLIYQLKIFAFRIRILAFVLVKTFEWPSMRISSDRDYCEVA
jgi:hypothetical protein